MTKDVRAVTADATLQELAEFFIEENVSGAPVVDGGRLVGVVSATDLVAFDADGRGVPTYEALPSSDLDESAPEPATGASGDFFTDPWDDARLPIRTRLSAGGSLWSSLQDQTVADVMTRELLTMAESSRVAAAAQAMLEAGVHRLLVMDGEELVGLVTTTDIVRAVAEHGLRTSDET